MPNGPFSRTVSQNGPLGFEDFFHTQTWYTTSKSQKRVPLPYVSRTAQVKNRYSDNTAVRNATVFYYTNNSWGRGNGRGMQECAYDSHKRFVARLEPTVQTMMNLVEARQTFRTFAAGTRAVLNPLEAIGKMMKNAARKRRVRGDTLPLSEVPDAYLAFQFGVLPVMGDIYNGFVRLSGKSPEDFWTPRITVQSKGQLSYSLTRGNYDWSFAEAYNICHKRSARVSVEVPWLVSLQGWGLLNPFHFAFDRYPLSFVLNWFWPIGTWMQSLTDLAGLKLQEPYTTKFCRFNGRQVYKQPSVVSDLTSVGATWQRLASYESLAIPRFINTKLGAGQLTTLGMLLAQRLRTVKMDLSYTE